MYILHIHIYTYVNEAMYAYIYIYEGLAYTTAGYFGGSGFWPAANASDETRSWPGSGGPAAAFRLSAPAQQGGMATRMIVTITRRMITTIAATTTRLIRITLMVMVTAMRISQKLMMIIITRIIIKVNDTNLEEGVSNSVNKSSHHAILGYERP